MAGQIIADASRLSALDESLRNTISQLDSVLAEHDAAIRATRDRLSDALYVWKRRQEQAYEKLIAAQDALARAQDAAQSRGDFTVPFFYYQEITVCRTEYEELSREYAEIGRISDDFERSASSYSSATDASRQDYVSILQKSSHILTQYIELIRKSSAALSGGGGANPSGIGAGGAGTEPSGIGAGGAGTEPSGIGAGGAAAPAEASRPGQSPGRFGNTLATTNQAWVPCPDGSLVFNTPVETGGKLDSHQGKVAGFRGTCGLVSCVNVLRLAGYPASESEVVGYASATSAGDGNGMLCTTGSFPESNGGTSAVSRQQILDHFGIRSELRGASVTNIADAVSDGRGVIISVYAGMLYRGWSSRRDLHAITVTSVKKDGYGNILGFYVCDSGTGGTDSARFYTALQIENALSGRPMNVTSIIR